ncbi:MAG: 4-hydroxy-tetrahydrodipicolinate synthase, partial [Chloroflexi bacterium]|nr:4-hydroxy-tetrahydrodipicolinate synthase [Chloroflexota bacterium]
MARIGRVLTAMVTPFGSDGAVDYAQAARLATALLASGSDGLVVTGTTGESPVLSHDEKLRLYETAKRAVGDRGTIIAGVGTYDTAASVALAREAREAGADGFLLVVPYYNKPPQEGLYRHFTAIADATDLPCILYNVPSRTVTNLAAETVARLSSHPHIVGIKEASGNLDQISKIIASCPEDFLVWSGNDGDTLPMLALGGYGVVSVASHVVGRQIRDMIERFVAGDTKGAAA